MAEAFDKEKWARTMQSFAEDLLIQEEKIAPEKPEELFADLQAQGRTTEDIIRNIKQCIATIPKSKASYSQKSLTDATHFSAAVSSLGVYLQGSLADSEVDLLSEQLTTATSQGLKKLMRLPAEAVGTFSNHKLYASILVGRAALHRIPEFPSSGVSSLSSNPVIYMSATQSRLGEELCSTLGFPISSLSLLDSSSNGSPTLEAGELEQLIILDKQAGKIPLVVFAVADTIHSDDIPRLKKVCKEYGVWLHIEGNAAPLMIASKPPSDATIISSCDSFSVNFGDWFGLARTIIWTCFPSSFSPDLKVHTLPLLTLPLWMFMQKMGPNYFTSSVDKAISLSSSLSGKLKVISNLVMVRTSPACVAFRFAPDGLSNSEPDTVALLNRLNEQVLLDLSEHVACSLGLQLVNEKELDYICFQPLFSTEVLTIKDGEMDAFIQGLNSETTLINATLQHAATFRECMERYQGLVNVKVTNFVGLGAIRYVPSYLSSSHDQGIDVKKELDNLNSTLAQQLIQLDPLFGKDKTTGGDTCITLGVDTKPLSLESIQSYSALIAQTAIKAEKQTGIVEKIADVIRKGIQQAEAELMKDEEDSIYEEGILRYVPVVGSVYNWFAPYEKPQLAGRRFDLASQSLAKGPDSPKKSSPVASVPRSPRPAVSTEVLPASISGSPQPTDPSPIEESHPSEDQQDSPANPKEGEGQ